MYNVIQATLNLNSQTSPIDEHVGCLECITIGPSPSQIEPKRQYSGTTKGVFVNLAMIANTFAKVTIVFVNDRNPTIQWGGKLGDAKLF